LHYISNDLALEEQPLERERCVVMVVGLFQRPISFFKKGRSTKRYFFQNHITLKVEPTLASHLLLEIVTVMFDGLLLGE
jgi:hypothetical protein